MFIDKAIPRTILLGALCAFCLIAGAQIQHGGKPYGGPIDPRNTDLPFFRMPKVDEAKLLREDSVRRANGLKVLRFARNISVNIDIRKDGMRTMTRDGRVVHRVGIHSPGALSLNFGFAPFELSDGAELFIYTPDQRKVLGSFTQANSPPKNSLSTMPVPEDRVVIELIEPKGANKQSQLVLERVSHAYRNVLKRVRKGERDFGDAGNCNMNVNCPDGKPWREQKRAVAMVIDNGNRHCSGALVNNTAEDGTPYFLTAAHCLDTGGPPSGWVFVFNYESPDCADQQGSTDQSISGSTLRARNEDSDFALVEMADTPPTSYGVFYAGWDHSGTPPDSSVCIHHPNGDIKKISFDDDQADSAQFKTSISNGEWQIKEWDRNTTTEIGSSGGPLFDEDGLIVGQLHGGEADCDSSINDYFGRFSVSWDRHAPADSQLEYWLDPIDTNATKWQGNDPLVGEHPYDGAVTSILSPDRVLCNDASFTAKVEFRNLGSQVLDSLMLYLVLGGDTLEKRIWNGTLHSGVYDTLTFSSFSVQDTGVVDLICGTRSPNGKTDPDPVEDREIRSLELRKDARIVDMELTTDCYGAETFWELLEKESGDTLYQQLKGSYPGTSNSPEKGGKKHVHTFCLEAGCYELQLHDSYGDGMKGSQYNDCGVDGELLIKKSNGEVLEELEEPGFGSDTTLSFCTDSVQPPSPPKESMMQVNPNPAPGWVRVQIKGDTGDHKLTIQNMRGQMVFRRELKLGAYRFDRRIQLPTLSQGLYILELEGPNGHYQRKLVIDR